MGSNLFFQNLKWILVAGGGDPSYSLIFWSGMFGMFVGIMYGVAR